MFPYEICKISNNFFNRTPPVAALPSPFPLHRNKFWYNNIEWQADATHIY